MQSTTIPAAHNPAGYTPQQITDTINRKNGGARISPRYSWVDDVKLAAIPGLNPPPVDSCVITNDTSVAVHRSIQLTMLEPVGVNTLRHLLQVWVQFFSTTGSLLFEIPIGIFRFILPDRDLSGAHTIWSVAGLDLTSRLAELDFANDYVVASYTNYVTLLYTLLQMDGLAKSEVALGARQPSGLWPDANNAGQTPQGLDAEGPNIPINRINIPASPYSLIVPLTAGQDTVFQAFCNSLTDAITYYPIWVDELGAFQSSRMPQYSSGLPPIGWTYNADSTSIITGTIKQVLTDQTKLANKVKVTSMPASAPVITSEKANRSTASAISLQNWGRTVRRGIRDDKIPTQDLADRRATIELQNAASQTDTISFTTAINPLHQSHDVLAVNMSSKGVAKITSSSGSPYIERSWSIDLKALTMSHVAERVIPV